MDQLGVSLKSSNFLTNLITLGADVHNGSADVVEAVEGLADQAQNLKKPKFHLIPLAPLRLHNLLCRSSSDPTPDAGCGSS